MSRGGRNWARDEIIIALYLYYIIPFNQVSARNATVIEYAQMLGRTPAALNMKIGNLGRLDKTLSSQNISGLKNGSKLDIVVWNEFEHQWQKLVEESERLIQSYEAVGQTEQKVVWQDKKGIEKVSQVKTRVNQSFFRASVLAAYDNRCCITGLNIPELLIASHIKPWKSDESNRLNPQNGLCLNALHDKAFDRGLIALADDFTVLLSQKIKNAQGFKQWFEPYEKKSIMLPERLKPDLDFLKYHREKVFID
ncbi:MAG: HNH endonuclease [Neisseria sp.]|nr:HNH endonuclease [Neisseria sp.]